jgi:phosphate transport system substrate-binding protein
MINGTADVAMASREMEPKEIQQMKAKGADPNEIIVARDAVAVVINPSNPVSKLTMDQLSDIYTGKITNWKQLGGKDQPIVALSRDKNSGTHVYFLEHVLRHGNAKGPEEYASEVLMMPSSQAIADEVKTNQAAIGYFGLGYLNKKAQKPVAVAKSAGSAYVEPSEKTVLSGQYPISRPLYLYTNGKPKGSIAKFVDFVLSSKGQSLVLKEGFVPLKGNR